MMRNKGILLIVCAAVFAMACDDAPPAEPEEPNYASSGVSAGSGSGGGGQVRVGAGQSSRETITDRYEMALGKIKRRDWDGAREDLLQALHRSIGHPIFSRRHDSKQAQVAQS